MCIYVWDWIYKLKNRKCTKIENLIVFDQNYFYGVDYF